MILVIIKTGKRVVATGRCRVLEVAGGVAMFHLKVIGRLSFTNSWLRA